MSGVLWCDTGDHAFSVKDRNRQHFVNTHEVPVLTGNSYGRPTYQDRQEVTEEIDICGPHWLKQNPFQTPEAKAIETTEVEAKQAEADMWKARYEADHPEYTE
jgi:acetone carboxylase gamma subunit